MEKPLYEDSQIKVDRHPTNGGYFIKVQEEGEDGVYTLNDGSLEQFDRMSRDRLKETIRDMDLSLLFNVTASSKISADSIGFALSQARMEEMRRIRLAGSSCHTCD